MPVRTKRVYVDPKPGDGTRILVDRLWPRGVSKEAAALDDWMQAVAPSNELRTWFDHDPERWPAFMRGYHAELADKPEPIGRLRRLADEGTVTLVFAARDETHNNARALKEFIEAG